MNSLLLVTGICLSTGLRLWGQTGADADDPTLAARLTELIGEASRDLELENAGTRDPIEVSAPLARLIVTLEEAWPKAKNLLPEIAPDDLTKSTVFRAAEELPIGMYLDALEIAMTLTENGAFNLAECLELLFPVGNGSFSRGNFLADNYQHPRIRSLLKRFRRVTESHAQINLPRT